MNTGIATTATCAVENGEFAVITADNIIVFCHVNSKSEFDMARVVKAINRGESPQPVMVNVQTVGFSAGPVSEDITK